ncbi:MAG: hypothetical protein AB1742_12075 [bacterium]
MTTGRGIGGGPPAVGADAGRFVFHALLCVVAITSLAIYYLFLTTRLDGKFFLIDEKKTECLELRKQIGQLESEVNFLRSYDRVESELKKANVRLTVPNLVYYFDLKNSRGMIARGNLERPGKGSI